MQYNILGKTGLAVSRLGFGAATLGDEYGTADPKEAERAVHYAIERGMTFFDVAPYYGRTLAETRLGEALQGRRDKVILATKCARFDIAGFDFSAAAVYRMAEESLKRLRTDYLDILHVHDIEFGHKQQIVEETVPALKELQKSGKVRFIGVTGLALKMLREVAEATNVDCVLSYCRYTLLNRDLDTELTPFAQKRGLGLINASPLGMRLLSDHGGMPWHPAQEIVKDTARRVVELCKARGAHAPDVALQFSIAHPYVSSTFVGISSVAEVESNLRAIEQPLDPDLMAEIEEITKPVHHTAWITGLAENH